MSYVLKLIEEGEHQQQDFKLRIDSSRKIAKTLVAFANTDGGRLLIGVKDSGKVQGASIEEEIHMIEGAAQMYCRPTIDYKSQVWHVDNKRVLEILIEPSDSRPHEAEIEKDQWVAYTRVEDKNFKANGVLQSVWKNEKTWDSGNFEYDKEKEKLFNYIKRREKITFMTVSKITKLSFKETETLLGNLILWGVLAMNYGKNGVYYTLTNEEGD